MQHIYIRELLHRRFLSVEANMPLKDVIALMHQQRYSCMVVTERDKPVGIVTEQDVLGLTVDLMQMYPTRPATVSDCMTTAPVCIQQDSTLYEAMVITQARQIRHLPVVDKRGRLLGVVSDSDISSAHLKEIERYRADIEGGIQKRALALETANDALKELSLFDASLGIGNRRAMEVDMEFTHVNALRQKRGYSVLMLEVDNYSAYCRDYGEQAGEEVLRQLTASVGSVVRSSDRLYRYDAHQFLVLLCETPLTHGLNLAERLLDAVEGLHIPHLQSAFGVITMSAGLSELNAVANHWETFDEAPADDWRSVVVNAQHWLAQAQAKGCNCMCWQAEENVGRTELNSSSGTRLAG